MLNAQIAMPRFKNRIESAIEQEEALAKKAMLPRSIPAPQPYWLLKCRNWEPCEACVASVWEDGER